MTCRSAQDTRDNCFLNCDAWIKLLLHSVYSEAVWNRGLGSPWPLALRWQLSQEEGSRPPGCGSGDDSPRAHAPRRLRTRSIVCTFCSQRPLAGAVPCASATTAQPGTAAFYIPILIVEFNPGFTQVGVLVSSGRGGKKKHTQVRGV